MSYIGIDIGTSSAKLLLVDETGSILKSVSKEYGVSMPQFGWSEQNPDDWIEAVFSGLHELLNGVDSSRIRSIGVDGQMHGLVILDSGNHVIRPAILWNDGRTTKETEYLNSVIGTDKLTEFTGNIAFAGFTAPKLLWLRENEPENFKKISKIMLPKDYLVYKLTGVHSCEPSDASGTLLYDVQNKCWSKEMLQCCGVTEDQLPKLHESSEMVGTILPDIASRFNLNVATGVCAGAADNAAAAVGCGIVGTGRCNISLGTSGTVFITNDKFSVDPKNALHSFAHADGGFYQMGCILSAASCNKWWVNDILHVEDFSDALRNITHLGQNNVYFLPYLMGERSPHNDTNVRGTFVGLSMDTSRNEMCQAVLEGVCFAIRDCFESAKAQGITVEESMICGGGSKSMTWCKIMANVLGIRLTLQKTEQGPAYGAAILGAVSVGDYKSVRECCEKWISIVDSIEPDPGLSTLYDERYHHWHTLYPMLKDFYAHTRFAN